MRPLLAVHCGRTMSLRVWLLVLYAASSALGESTAAASSGVEGQLRLVHVAVVFRHGDRAPLTTFPGDPNRRHVWTMGRGQLTTRGRQTMWALGKWLRDRYGRFLSWDVREVNARSSPVPRCFDSAALLLYGLYPAQGENRRWKPDQDWQPVPITSVPDGADKYATLCMRHFEETIGAFSAVKEPPSLATPPSSPKAGTEFGTAGRMLEYVAKMAHVTEKPGVVRFTAISRVLDALFVYHEYNMPLPEWATRHLRQLEWLNEQLVHQIALYQMDNMAGLLLSDLLASIRIGKAKGMSLTQGKDDTNEGPKITLMSYHDMNVAGLLLGLNNTLSARPPYGAALILEVLSPSASPTAERYARVLFKAGQQISNIPIEGCDDPCPLKQFDEVLHRKFKPVSRAECGWSKDQPLV